MSFRLTLSTALTLLVASFVLVMPTAGQAQNAAAPTVSERFGEWLLSCRARADGSELCEVRQIRQTQDENPLTMALALTKLNGQYQLIGVVPFGTLLQVRPAFGVDDTEVNVPGNYVICAAGGCRVVFPADETTLAAMAANEFGRVAVMRPDRQAIGFRFPLAGFSEARAALDARQ